MKTGNIVKPEQNFNVGNEPVFAPPAPGGDGAMDKPAISDLLAAADAFNAAFNTALYELEASRRLVNERDLRIEELDASIRSLNTALNDGTRKTRTKDEVHATESEASSRRIIELESERDRLRQQAAEQRKSLNEQAGEIRGLSSCVAELTASLEQQKSDSLRTAESLARERAELNHTHDVLRKKYDAVCGQMKVLHAELKERNNEIAALSRKADTLVAELASLSKTGKQQEVAHREESESLHREIQDLKDTLRTKEELLEQSQQELDCRNSEIASSNDRIDELRHELDNHTAKIREETESHARVCAELNERISSLSSDYESLQVAHKELTAQTVTLENLNRALHESTASEHDVHKKIVDEKDAAIATLQARLAAMKRPPDTLALDTGADRDSSAALAELEAKLRESESLARRYEKRAGLADELEAQVEQLSRELQMFRGSSGAAGAEDHGLEKDLQDRGVELQSTLENAGSGQEAAEQEIVRPWEARNGAGGNPEGAAGMNETVMSLQDEIEKPGPEPAACARKDEQSQAVPVETQRQPLTGELPSPDLDRDPAALIVERDRFVSSLNKLLAEPRASGAKHAVMYVLVDSFIRVREDIGLMNSERVLEEISGFIESHCGENELITRFGDCTFAVVFREGGADRAQKIAERIRTTIENHIFEITGRTLVTTASIGICAVRDSDTDADQVISRADLACEAARLSGGNRVVVNSPVSDELCMPGSTARHAETVDRVLAENRIKIYYQPISNLKDNTINRFEVLTRIVDENSNIILPGEFFSMAANSGKAMEVDRHIVEVVLRTLAEKPDPEIKLFIKLTGPSVSCHDLPIWIMNKIREYAIHPGQLVFEVTEQVLECDLKNLSMLSRALNTIGCKLAIEHYRLATKAQHLRHVHADYLKIDSGLVQNISGKGDCLARVTEIMAVAKNYDLTVIAEGVESPACLAILWELGVNYSQGYFISEPASDTNFDNDDPDAGYEASNDGKAVYTLG